MATIVRYDGNGRSYLLVGTGFGASMHVANHLFASDKGEKLPMAVLADGSGKLHWVRTTDVTVVSVDGARPQDLLRTVRPQDLPVIDPPPPGPSAT